VPVVAASIQSPSPWVGTGGRTCSRSNSPQPRHCTHNGGRQMPRWAVTSIRFG
jgi:hypothetical protein